MNKFFRSLAAAVLLVPGIAFAAGYYGLGQVYVGPDSYLEGAMNVRWNSSAAGSPYIYATGYAGSYVGFFGRDSENEYFSCFVSTTNPLYAQALDIKNNLKSGSRLYVTKSPGNSECTNVFLGNYSYYQQ